MNKLFCFMVVMLLLPAVSMAEPATIIKETIVRMDPGHQADPITTLSAGEEVEIKRRQGGWYQVSFGEKQTSGYLPLLSIRKASSGTRREGKSGLNSLLNTYRTGSSGVTVATGVRGLDQVDLQNSKPDMDELRKIDAFTSNPEAAEHYADQAGLVSRDIDWIDPAKGGSQ